MRARTSATISSTSIAVSQTYLPARSTGYPEGRAAEKAILESTAEKGDGELKEQRMYDESRHKLRSLRHDR
jgi:hypothetical protein